MEVALRRRLAGVADISISQRDQRAEVTFLPGPRVFSAAEFRRAVDEADVEVLSLQARVCGLVDEGNAVRAGESGHQTIVQLRGDARPGSSICATGRLDDGVEPYGLDVIIAQPRG